MKIESPVSRRQFIPLLGLFVASAAQANIETVDMSRAVYVPMSGVPQVCFIDPDGDRIAGVIDVGMVPDQIGLAASVSKLLVTDGTSTRLNIVDVVTSAIITAALPFIPREITVDPNGLTAAIADDVTGRIILFDMMRRQIIGIVTGPAPLRDMMFSSDGRALYISGGDDQAIAVVDVKAADVTRRIPTNLTSATLALTRSPDGRRLFVQSRGGDVGVIDLDRGQPVAPIGAPAGSTVAFPSATGVFLFIADNQLGKLTVIHEADKSTRTVLNAASGVRTVYTAWFETLALVPSEVDRSLLLYDLDTLRPAGTIGLVAAPGRGAVTPDGRKLYLPLPDAKQVAVFDARKREMLGYVSVPYAPAKVVLAGSYGICH